MNKSVEVKGMQLKAEAKKGILINEMAGASDGTWSAEALAGQSSAIALRPALTLDLTNWWHTNCKITSNESGAGTGDTTNTVALDTGVYYSDIMPDATGITAADTTAIADTNAARTVYYSDGVGGNANTHDDGEGYYILYKYYIKTSGNTALNVTAGNLKAVVKATKINNDTENISTDLDKAMRVGIKVSGDTKTTIFAPCDGADGGYNVTQNVGGTAHSAVTPVRATATGTATDATSINTATVTLPAVTASGLEVDVYVWFEGDDTNCKSYNLTAILDSYQIDIVFSDADLG
ncbi:hypothetical protein [Ruminococcus albus]|nr:hypothetical protein [Ruminococcus albus]